MITIVVTVKNKCLLWHCWELIFGNSKTHYFVCKKCSSRKAEQQSGNYQSIDWDFLNKAIDV